MIKSLEAVVSNGAALALRLLTIASQHPHSASDFHVVNSRGTVFWISSSQSELEDEVSGQV